MFNFEIRFEYPWLLLLLIPAIALTLLPYFRIAKRYRRTRNRVISVVLHSLVMLLTISLLAGICFFFEVHNSENEILLLVDASYSTHDEKEAKHNFVSDVIAMSDANVYKIGIVTFGYTQEYAAPISAEYADLFNQYLNAPLPDTSATDIAAALTYAKGLFTKPETAKIVLISDGIETDENALSVVRGLTADGMRIDTVCTSTLLSDKEAQIVEAVVPDFNINTGEKFNIGLTIKSTYKESTETTVTITDNGEKAGEVTISLKEGTQTVEVPHTFGERGLHSLNFVLKNSSDTIEENNSFYTYMFLETFNQVLIIENVPGQSDTLSGILGELEVKVFDIADAKLPKTSDELRQFDEVILNNISNADLQTVPGLDRALSDYVYLYGGGLFTVGGGENGEPEKAHAYNREDMAGSLYQQMLPVQAIDYTPPLGLMIVIDVSGSMNAPSGGISKLQAAIDSAVSIVKDETCLTERDYCGILTLSDSYEQASRLLPMTKQDEILEAIYSIEKGNDTNFAPSIEKAGMDLVALYNAGKIEKMHTILITDGAAGDAEAYMDAIKRYHDRGEGVAGVSYSFVAVEATSTSMAQLEKAAELGGGHAVNCTSDELSMTLKDDIRVPEIKEVEYGEFVPEINKDSYYASVITQEEMPVLEGFYGTRARQSAEVVLSGKFNVPIFAQWKYGEGTVGSFMCDLNGVWSQKFVSADPGKKLITSIVQKLFPTENIRPKEISVSVREDNYTTHLSIYTSSALEEGESIRVSVENLANPGQIIEVVAPNANEGYTRSSFKNFMPGTYIILVEKLDAENRIKASYTLYKSFSYSEEYNVLDEHDDRVQLMESVAGFGGGASSLMEECDPWSVFEGFVTSIPKSFDPTLTFIIAAIVMFLADIAVRKFKFKWPHELIREYKEKKNGR